MTNGSTFKERAHLLVDSLPDDADWKGTDRRDRGPQDIEEGLYDSEDGNLLDNEEIRLRYEGGE